MSSRTPRRRLRIWPLVVAAVVALGLGVVTAHTDYAFGPHEATYEVTLDHTLSVDLGPLGSILLDTGTVPQLAGRTGPLGLRVTVHEIPSALDLGNAAQTRDELAAKLAAYAQLFADPGASIAIVAQRLISSALLTALVAWLAFAAGYSALYLLLGPRRRAFLAADMRRHGRWAVVGGVLVVALAVVAVVSRPQPSSADAEPLSALSGTPLKGARVTGLLGGVLQTYGGLAVSAYQQNEEFYTQASAAMVAELATTEAPADTVPVLMVSDLHCNIGMFPVIGATASALGTKLVVNGGDTTVSGTSVESYCVDSLARAIPRGVTMVVAGGNHDSEETDKQEKKAGWVVLDGSVTEVEGLRFLGDSDPRLSALGSGTVLKGAETVPELGERMAQTAREDGDVDILLIHDPMVARATLVEGGAPLALTGHLHKRFGPEVYGQGVLYTSSSTGRGVDQATMIGPLKGDAELTVFYVDPETKRATHYRILTVTPQASVDVGPAYPMPVAPMDAADDGADDGTPDGPPSASSTATPLPQPTALPSIPTGDPDN